MSVVEKCYICYKNVGKNGGVLSVKCFGEKCARREYCRDCIIECKNKHFACPICKKFLPLPVWTGVKMFVAFMCIILSATAVGGYILERNESNKNSSIRCDLLKFCADIEDDRAAERAVVITIIATLWTVSLIPYLLTFLFVENYGIFEEQLTPVVDFYCNVKSRMRAAAAPAYHMLISAIKTILPCVLVWLLCWWLVFVARGVRAFVANF